MNKIYVFDIGILSVDIDQFVNMSKLTIYEEINISPKEVYNITSLKELYLENMKISKEIINLQNLKKFVNVSGAFVSSLNNNYGSYEILEILLNMPRIEYIDYGYFPTKSIGNIQLIASSIYVNTYLFSKSIYN